MKAWKCSKCGHVVIANERPAPIKWDDGHICSFIEDRKYFKFDDLTELPPPSETIFYKKGESEE